MSQAVPIAVTPALLMQPVVSAAEKQAKMFDGLDEAEQQAAYSEKDLKGE